MRVSTESQSEETGLDTQRQAIIAYAAANGIRIEQWYQDVESGAKESRPGLDALRGSAAAGLVTKLLVYRIDRLARDLRIGDTVHRELRAAGAEVVSVSEAMIDGSLTGNLMRSIILAFAEYERSVIALRTTTGRRHRVAHSGSWAGGTAPYGYEALGDKGRPGHGALRVREEQAEAVREVFSLRDRGASLTEIATALNERGFRTSRGALFGPMQVKRILDRREVYAGLATPTRTIALEAGVSPQQPAILE